MPRRKRSNQLPPRPDLWEDTGRLQPAFDATHQVTQRDEVIQRDELYDLAEQPGYGERLRELREGRGLTQKELAKLFGVSVVTISRLENDHFNKRPQKRTIQRLAGVLEVDWWSWWSLRLIRRLTSCEGDR
jgi:ribosome-binding protein aMBF1 (putative translation factor)